MKYEYSMYGSKMICKRHKIALKKEGKSGFGRYKSDRPGLCFMCAKETQKLAPLPVDKKAKRTALNFTRKLFSAIGELDEEAYKATVDSLTVLPDYRIQATLPKWFAIREDQLKALQSLGKTEFDWRTKQWVVTTQ